MITPACLSLMRDMDNAATVKELIEVAQRIQTIAQIDERGALERKFKTRYDTFNHRNNTRRTAR